MEAVLGALPEVEKRGGPPAMFQGNAAKPLRRVFSMVGGKFVLQSLYVERADDVEPNGCVDPAAFGTPAGAARDIILPCILRAHGMRSMRAGSTTGARHA